MMSVLLSYQNDSKLVMKETSARLGEECFLEKLFGCLRKLEGVGYAGMISISMSLVVSFVLFKKNYEYNMILISMFKSVV